MTAALGLEGIFLARPEEPGEGSRLAGTLIVPLESHPVVPVWVKEGVSAVPSVGFPEPESTNT